MIDVQPSLAEFTLAPGVNIGQELGQSEGQFEDLMSVWDVMTSPCEPTHFSRVRGAMC